MDLRVEGNMSPSPRNVTVLTNKGTNNRLPIAVAAEASPEAERRAKVPRVSARAEGALHVDLPSPVVVDGSPNARRFEVLEKPSEEHVVAILLGVDAARPVAEVERVAAELRRQKLAPLLPPQIPVPARQMRPPAVAAFGGDAGVAEARAADGELEEGGGGGGGGGVAYEGREGLGAFGPPAGVADEGEESGADAGHASPVAWIVLQL